MIHYFPGGGARRITTPGYICRGIGYVLDGRSIKELINPWYSVYPPTKTTDYELTSISATLARTREELIRIGKVVPRAFAE